MSEQPEALRLANRMALIGASMDGDADRAAAELRRLHALCEEMGEALEIADGTLAALAKWKESK